MLWDPAVPWTCSYMQSHDVTKVVSNSIICGRGGIERGLRICEYEGISFRKKSGRPKETQTCNRMWRKERVTGRNGALEILVKGFLRNLGISLRGRETKRAEAVFGYVCVCGYMPSRFSCVHLLVTRWTESDSCSVMSDSL